MGANRNLSKLFRHTNNQSQQEGTTQDSLGMSGPLNNNNVAHAPIFAVNVGQ